MMNSTSSGVKFPLIWPCCVMTSLSLGSGAQFIVEDDPQVPIEVRLLDSVDWPGSSDRSAWRRGC